MLTSLVLKKFGAVTFDPANVVIEGKEDWDYGIALLSPYIQNVHVKNVIWNSQFVKTHWNWSPIQVGVLNWAEIISTLIRNGYNGDYAMEDFLLNTKDQDWATHQVQEFLNHLTRYYEYGRSLTHPNIIKTHSHYSQVLT